MEDTSENKLKTDQMVAMNLPESEPLEFYDIDGVCVRDFSDRSEPEKKAFQYAKAKLKYVWNDDEKIEGFYTRVHSIFIDYIQGYEQALRDQKQSKD